MKKQAVIGVMGSGSKSYNIKSEPLGKWIAKNNFHLLTGGGPGVMSAVSESFFKESDRTGLSIGIIPGKTENGYRPLTGYPNPWIELPVFTHLPLSGNQGTSELSRNHINVLSADIIVALPGGAGTASEILLALKYKKPVIGFINDINEISGLKVDIPCFARLDDLISKILELKQLI